MQNNKNTNWKRVKAVISIASLSRILLIAGIFLFFISLIDLKASGINWLKGIAEPYKDITKNLGLTCISAGLVSILVEVSTITEVVRTAVMQIVQGDFPFENFSMERLNELHKQLVVKRSGIDKMQVEDLNYSAYALEDELLEASRGIYYEYNKAVYIITHDNETGVFKKRAEFEYRIINRYSQPNKIKFTISVIHPSDSLGEAELKEKFKIEKFTIARSNKLNKAENFIDLTQGSEKYISVRSIEGKTHSMYKYEVEFEYELDNSLRSDVAITYEYAIPDDDMVQAYKVNYPCKVLDHTIIVKPDTKMRETWEIEGDAYTAFYFPPTDKDYQVIQKVPDTIQISFRDWSIPGAGYMTFFKKK